MTQPRVPEMKRRKDDGQRDALVVATEVLSNRVVALADAVQINNYEIQRLSKEVDLKPDDAEVKFITGMAMSERTRHLRYALATGIVTAVLSGFIAFTLADNEAERRCDETQSTTDRLVRILESFRPPVGEPSERLDAAIKTLQENRTDC